MTQQPPQPPEPRIGHAEREAAAEQLREAAGLGRIDLDELDERLGQAFSARTQSELDALLADLRPAPSRTPLHRPDAPGHRPDDPLTLAAGAGSVKKRGRWEMPPFVRISPGMGTVKLDCREAVATSEVVHLDVTGSVGTTVLVVPEGWAADIDRLSPGWGTLKNKLPNVPAPGCPTLVLHGQLGMGTLRLRHATWWDGHASTGHGTS